MGSLDEKKQLIDTLDTWGDEGLVTRYEKVVDKEGGHILSGVLVEVVLVSDSLQKVVGRYPFEYKYEVLPKHTLD